MKLSRSFQALLYAALLAGTGCEQSTHLNAPREPVNRGSELVHHLGAVFAGSKVEHTFEIRNTLGVAIAVCEHEGIEKTCGCSTLEPSVRQLAPGERATIRVRVDTSGKLGRFRVGGSVRWRTEAGQTWPVKLYLDGTARSLLASKPGLVQFSRDEVANKVVKEVEVFHSAEVDWATVQVYVEPPYAELVETTFHGDRATLKLRATPPAGVADFSTSLRLSVALKEAQPGFENCALSVVVQGSQHIQVQVSPRIVFANWSTDSRRGTARFLVRGLDSVSGDISSVSCDGFQAAWSAKDISPRGTPAYRTLQVELNLSEPNTPPLQATQSGRVRIGLLDGRSLEVPVYFVAQQQRS